MLDFLGNFLNANGTLLVSMVIAGVLALSLYVPLMTGQLSLASAGFYGLGGYVAAILSESVFPSAHGNSSVVYMLIEMLIGGLLAGLLALPVGILALRVRGIYLALATAAFVEVTRIVSLNLDITGGAVGIFGVPQPFPTQAGYLWVAVPLLLISLWFVYRIERIRIGRAFIALREDELAASAIGIHPMRYRLLAFVIGAVLAGAAGALSAHLLNIWDAREGTFDESIAILAFVLVGGSRTAFGPVLGGMLLTALPEVLRGVGDISTLPSWLSNFLINGRFIVYGLLIAVGVLFFPQGLLSPDTFKRLRPKRQAGPTEPNEPVAEPAGQMP